MERLRAVNLVAGRTCATGDVAPAWPPCYGARMRILTLAAALLLSACASHPPEAPAPTIAASWTAEQADAVLARTQRVHLAPDMSALTPGERAAVTELMAAGERMHLLYMVQRHPDARAANAFIAAHPELTRERDLFRMNVGPIATTLDNTREAFLSVSPESPSRNMYPAGTTRATLDAYIAAHPERRAELLDSRTVVWPATDVNRQRILTILDHHPVFDTLHPGLADRTRAAQDYFAVPYSVTFAHDTLFIFEKLNAAADHVADGDPAFARYLRLRARDILADDYEGGDAAWVTGEFTGNLNAQIGAYETYDDALYGVKTFYALSLLIRDIPRSRELAAGLSGLQAIEDALPYQSDREVRSRIPVSVYNIVADFGQARGVNTATILPNDAYLTRQYGRTILMRGNILLNEDISAETQRAFDAAVADANRGHLTAEGGFYRTLWHEIGHYLGVDQTADGRELDAALEDTADLLEEMKADLVSLTAARILHDRGQFSDAQMRGIYASGIRRVLQKNRPRREQPYQTMQLIQWNWFLQHGVLRFEGGRLAINYARYPAAVESLLRETLAIQRAGDRARANAFVDQWTTWRSDLHEVIAQRMRETERYRFNLVTYEALDGPQTR
ncbi:nudix hydrolase 3 [alpha proteobacterium U9-1i]|nr:nudix hydrolase 3 [alpha proteobacterium U9-1i]